MLSRKRKKIRIENWVLLVSKASIFGWRENGDFVSRLCLASQSGIWYIVGSLCLSLSVCLSFCLPLSFCLSLFISFPLSLSLSSSDFVSPSLSLSLCLSLSISVFASASVFLSLSFAFLLSLGLCLSLSFSLLLSLSFSLCLYRFIIFPHPNAPFLFLKLFLELPSFFFLHSLTVSFFLTLYSSF